MNVHLGETSDKFVAELLESGLYQSQSEVIREGLRLAGLKSPAYIMAPEM
jgi:antitoxin ParD1/3/4